MVERALASIPYVDVSRVMASEVCHFFAELLGPAASLHQNAHIHLCLSDKIICDAPAALSVVLVVAIALLRAPFRCLLGLQSLQHVSVGSHKVIFCTHR